MRKLTPIVAALILVFGISSAYSLDLQPIEGDFHALMLDIGETIAPNLQSMAISGNSIGEASINAFTLQFLGVGLATFDGIANILHGEGNYAWKFVLPLSDIVSTAASSAKDIYDFTGNVFGIPSINFALGFPVGWGFEVIGSGFWIPKETIGFAVSTFSGMIGASTASMITGLNPELSVLNAGLKVRKVFIKDAGAAPALSASLGFVYSDFGLSATIPSLAAVLGKPLVLTGIGELEAKNSSLSIATHTLSYGLELSVSKRLAIITPFARLAAWYQNSTYDSNIALNAEVTASGSPLLQPINSKVSKTVNDLSLYATGGCELNLLGLVVSPSLTIDLEKPIIDFKSLTATGITLNGVMFNLGFRLSY